MSRRGFVVWPRALMEHPALRDFADRAAFLDLVADAAWRPETVRRGRAVVTLQRGQVLVSVRELSDRWGWSLKRVRGFLARLTQGTPGDTLGGTLADTLPGTEGTVLTIREYWRFSGRDEGEDTPEGTPADTPKGTPADTHKKEGKKETRKEGSPVSQSGARASARGGGGAVPPVAPEAVATAAAVGEALGLGETAVPAEAVAQWLGEGVSAGALVAWARAKRDHVRRAADLVRYIGQCVRSGQVRAAPDDGSAGAQVVPIALSQWRSRLGSLRRRRHWMVGGLSLAGMRAELGDAAALGLVREVFGAGAEFGDVERLERGEVA